MTKKGIIVWKGDEGAPEANLSKSVIDGVTSGAALTTLATALGAHSDCNVAHTIYSESTIDTPSAPGGTPPVNVDYRGILYFRNATTEKIVRLTIASPVSGDIEDTINGTRYTSVAGLAIQALLETATGKDLVFLWGKDIKKG